MITSPRVGTGTGGVGRGRDDLAETRDKAGGAFAAAGNGFLVWEVAPRSDRLAYADKTSTFCGGERSGRKMNMACL